MSCPKCGGATVEWIKGTQLCKRWQCWDFQPTNPDDLDRGIDPLYSELEAFSKALLAIYQKHGPFLSCAFRVSDERLPPTQAMMSMMTGSLAVMWQMFMTQMAAHQPDVSILRNHFLAMVRDFADHVSKPENSMVMPVAGQTIN